MIYFVYVLLAIHVAICVPISLSLLFLELKNSSGTAFAIVLLQAADIAALAFLLFGQ